MFVYHFSFSDLILSSTGAKVFIENVLVDIPPLSLGQSFKRFDGFLAVTIHMDLSTSIHRFVT